jgi:transposase
LSEITNTTSFWHIDAAGGRPHQQYKRIAIDTSKAVFTLHGIDAAERPTLRISLHRAGLIAFFRKLLPTEIVVEACGAAYHWARELSALGHDVRLIPPQYVKPFVERGKNDRNDAAAICEAGGRPEMRFVPVKSIERQAQSMVLKVRQTLTDQRPRWPTRCAVTRLSSASSTAKGPARP